MEHALGNKWKNKESPLFRVFVFVHVLHITPAFVFLYSLCLIFTSLSKSFYCSFLHCSSLFTFLLHFVFRAAVLFQKSVFFSFYIFPSGGCSPHSGFFNSFYFFLFFCLSSWLVDARKLMSVNIITNNPLNICDYVGPHIQRVYFSGVRIKALRAGVRHMFNILWSSLLTKHTIFR